MNKADKQSRKGAGGAIIRFWLRGGLQARRASLSKAPLMITALL